MLEKRGGVGILVHNTLHYKRINSFDNLLKDIELCAIEIKTHYDKVLAVSLYRPPNSNLKTFMAAYKKLVTEIKRSDYKLYFIGLDHNLDFLNLDKHEPTRKFIEFNMENQIWPTITKPTRITKNSASLIDNIMVSHDVFKKFRSCILTEDLSDHLPCYLIAQNLKLKKKDPPVITSRKITPKTLEKIKNALDVPHLYNTVQKGSVNDAFESFHDGLLSIIDKEAPLETYQPSKNKYRKEAWLPVSLLQNIKRQKYLYRKSLHHHASKADHEVYKNYRNILTKLK